MFVFRVVFLVSLPSGIRFRVSHSTRFYVEIGRRAKIAGALPCFGSSFAEIYTS